MASTAPAAQNTPAFGLSQLQSQFIQQQQQQQQPAASASPFFTGPPPNQPAPPAPFQFQQPAATASPFFTGPPPNTSTQAATQARPPTFQFQQPNPRTIASRSAVGPQVPTQISTQRPRPQLTPFAKNKRQRERDLQAELDQADEDVKQATAAVLAQEQRQLETQRKLRTLWSERDELQKTAREQEMQTKWLVNKEEELRAQLAAEQKQIFAQRERLAQQKAHTKQLEEEQSRMRAQLSAEQKEIMAQQTRLAEQEALVLKQQQRKRELDDAKRQLQMRLQREAPVAPQYSPVPSNRTVTLFKSDKDAKDQKALNMDTPFNKLTVDEDKIRAHLDSASSFETIRSHLPAKYAVLDALNNVTAAKLSADQVFQLRKTCMSQYLKQKVLRDSNAGMSSVFEVTLPQFMLNSGPGTNSKAASNPKTAVLKSGSDPDAARRDLFFLLLLQDQTMPDGDPIVPRVYDHWSCIHTVPVKTDKDGKLINAEVKERQYHFLMEKFEGSMWDLGSNAKAINGYLPSDAKDGKGAFDLLTYDYRHIIRMFQILGYIGAKFGITPGDLKLDQFLWRLRTPVEKTRLQSVDAKLKGPADPEVVIVLSDFGLAGDKGDRIGRAIRGWNSNFPNNSAATIGWNCPITDGTASYAITPEISPAHTNLLQFEMALFRSRVNSTLTNQMTPAHLSTVVLVRGPDRILRFWAGINGLARRNPIPELQSMACSTYPSWVAQIRKLIATEAEKGRIVDSLIPDANSASPAPSATPPTKPRSRLYPPLPFLLNPLLFTIGFQLQDYEIMDMALVPPK